MQAMTITTADGAQLAVRVYESAANTAQRSRVIGGAMGARQDYQPAFAQWLGGLSARTNTA